MKFGKLYSALLTTFMLSSTAIFAIETPSAVYGNGEGGTTTTVTSAGSSTIEGDSGTATVPFAGTINITQLSVVVPTSVPFYIDPSAALNNSKSQVTAPSNIRFINNSVVPVTVKISNLEGSTGVTFTNDKDSLNVAKSVMFTLSSTDTAIAIDENTEPWLTNAIVPGTPSTHKSINDGTAIAADGGELEIYVHGATKKGWKKGETFTITPTLTIAAEEYVAP